MTNAEKPVGRAGPLSAQDAFAELSKLLSSGQPITSTLAAVADLARRAIPGIAEASVTMMNGDAPWTIVFTGNVAMVLDERQYESGFGPCTDAAVSGGTMVVDNRDPRSRYPEFSTAAADAGMFHTVSVGLPMPERVVGALNLYISSTDALDTPAVELAEVFASYAAVALVNSAQFASTADLAESLRRAVRSRLTIELAKGILMARYSYSADRAFADLLTTARDQKRPLHQVAQAIVDGIDTKPDSDQREH